MSSKTIEQEDADLSAIGKHCSFPDCNRLDFLPVKCDLCDRVFCKEHYSLTAHKCDKYSTTSAASATAQATTSTSKSLTFETYACSFGECTTRERVRVTCEFCGKDFCMKHRLQVDHECVQLKAAAAAKTDAKKHEVKEFKFEMKQNVSEKNAALASKLALMKLKQSAQGPPGLTEQFKYFCFVVVESTTHPFFFSTKWPLGKCIEFIETKLKLAPKLVNLYLDNDQKLDTSKTVEELVKSGSLANQGLYLYLK